MYRLTATLTATQKKNEQALRLGSVGAVFVPVNWARRIQWIADGSDLSRRITEVMPKDEE